MKVRCFFFLIKANQAFLRFDVSLLNCKDVSFSVQKIHLVVEKLWLINNCVASISIWFVVLRIVEQEYLQICNECLNFCWRFTIFPACTFIQRYFEPLCLFRIPMVPQFDFGGPIYTPGCFLKGWQRCRFLWRVIVFIQVLLSALWKARFLNLKTLFPSFSTPISCISAQF